MDPRHFEFAFTVIAGMILLAGVCIGAALALIW